MHILARAIRFALHVVRFGLRQLHRVWFALFAKHSMASAWLIAALCLCAGAYDLAHRRRTDALLWVATGGCVLLGFLVADAQTGIMGTPVEATGAVFGVAALAAGLCLAVRQLRPDA